MNVFLIPFMMFLGRGAGSDWFGFKQVFGALFALTIGVSAFFIHGGWVAGLIGFLIAWGGFETGHGTFYEMTGYHNHNGNGKKPRKEKIEYVVRPIFQGFSGNIYHPSYSWVCMGLKGFLIGLPLGFWGFPLVLFYPAAYWYGMVVEDRGAVAELVAALFVGLFVVCAL